jgi:hypothetical protein
MVKKPVLPGTAAFLAIWEAEIAESWFQTCSGKRETPSQPIAGHSVCICHPKLHVQEAEVRRFSVPGQPKRRKVGETPSQQKKLGLVVPACHPRQEA